MPVASNEHQHQEQIYCAEQINIPVTLPSILKCYAKAAIRTQPYDLLSWTSAYFRALANGELPPVKERLEYPLYAHPSGITPRFLKILLNQYCHDEDRGKMAVKTDRTPRTMSVTIESLLGRWHGMALKDSSLYQILMTGRLLELTGAPTSCDLYRFLAIACGLLGHNLLETMIYICELLTKEPDGGSAMISFRIFMNLYEYLANLDCTGGQAIIVSGLNNAEARIERDDEASLVRSSHSSFSPSTISSSSCTSEVSSNVKETRAAGCRSYDNSFADTETEESLCSFEVIPCDRDEEFASPDRASIEQAQFPDNTIAGGSTRKPCGCGFSTRRETSPSTKRGETKRKTRIPRLESTSENAMYDDEKCLKLKVPECSGDERLSGGGAEVTRVQEERRRRRDVEMHSRAEKVRPMVDDDETKTIAQPRLSLVSSAPTPSHRGGTSSSSSDKSHVVFVKDVGASEMATSEETTSQEFDQTDNILEARFAQLPRESGGADVSHAADPSITNDPIENYSHDRGDTTAARNINPVRRKIKRSRKKKVDESASGRTRNNEKIIRDSFEYDEPTTNDEDDFVSSKKRYSRRKTDDKIPPEVVDDAREGQGDARDGGIISYPGDYIGPDENESLEGEEYEDMAEYETIGLENILDGICECLETTKDTRNPENASTSSQLRKSSTTSKSLDVVAEFIERMRATECPTGAYVLPEVPGIGPPVSNETVTAVGLWLAECSRRQQGQVGPRNLRHFMCPNLDGRTSRREDYSKTTNTCPTRD